MNLRPSFPKLFILFALTAVVPLFAAEKGFLGLKIDMKGDPSGSSSVFNPTIMSAWVSYIVPKSPADGHGMAIGDIVLAIDGVPAPGCKLSALKAKMSAGPGQTIHLKLKRSNGEIYTADLTVVPKTW